MKRSSLGAMVALLCLLLLTVLGGCAEFFTFNLLKSLDPVPLPSPEELAAMPEGEALDYLSQELGSPVFVEKLVEDPAVYGAVEAILYGAMNDPATEPKAASGPRCCTRTCSWRLREPWRWSTTLHSCWARTWKA